MLFYLSFGLCVLGFVFLGWGVILFPLSLFCIFRAKVDGIAFALIVVADIAGFSLSLYLVSKKILELMLI